MSRKTRMNDDDEFLTRAREFKTGDLLTLSDFRLMDGAFEAIKRQAHQTRARRPREGEHVRELRRLISIVPDWRERVTKEQRKILELRFNPSAKALASSTAISNADIARKLKLSAQMITHHIREAIETLRQTAQESDTAGVSESAHVDASQTPSDGLKTDSEWQRLLRWRRRLGKLIASQSNPPTAREHQDPEPMYLLTATDRRNIREVAERLQRLLSQSVEAPAAAAETHAATGQSPEENPTGRRGRRSPAEFVRVRELLIARPDLVENLTRNQRETLRTGLALDEKDLPVGAALGYRRFDESQSMTAARFGIVFKSARARLLPFLDEHQKSPA